MPAVPKHRKPIVDAAVTLFRRQGFAGTGLNDIIDSSGAPKGSLYHYFPAGKASIAVAAVDEAGRRVAETMTALAAETRSTADLLRAHARLLSGWLRKSGFRDGCPITTVLLELSPMDRGVAESGRKAYAARIDILKRKLTSDGFSPASTGPLAILCVSALQGALIQARVERSGAPIEIAAEQLRKCWRRWQSVELQILRPFCRDSESVIFTRIASICTSVVDPKRKVRGYHGLACA